MKTHLRHAVVANIRHDGAAVHRNGPIQYVPIPVTFSPGLRRRGCFRSSCKTLRDSVIVSY